MTFYNPHNYSRVSQRTEIPPSGSLLQSSARLFCKRKKNKKHFTPQSFQRRRRSIFIRKDDTTFTHTFHTYIIFLSKIPTLVPRQQFLSLSTWPQQAPILVEVNYHLSHITNSLQKKNCFPAWKSWRQPEEQETLAAKQPAVAKDVPELLQLARLPRRRAGLRAHGAHTVAPGVSPGN